MSDSNNSKSSALDTPVIPPELILEIARQCDPQSQARLSQASKGTNELLGSTLTKTAKEFALPPKEAYEKHNIFDGVYIPPEVEPEGDEENEYVREPLAEAIKSGDVSTVKMFLEAGADPNSYTLEGIRMLCLALYVGDVPPYSECEPEIIDLLLKHGADPSLADLDQTLGQVTPITCAASRSHMNDHFVQLLINAGARPQSHAEIHGIVMECSLETVQLAVEHGFDLMDQTPVTLESTLQSALQSEGGQETFLWMLEAAPALLQLTDIFGQTALWIALEGMTTWSMDAVDALVEAQIDLDVVCHAGGTALHFALQRQQSEKALLLLANGITVGLQDAIGFFELHLAAKRNYPDVAVELLKRAAVNVNALDNFMHTALHVAASAKATEVAAVLLEQEGVLANPKDTLEQTPLYVASRKDAEGVVKLLLARSDILIDSAGNEQSTPLHIAALYGSEKVATMLVAAGAGINLQNRDGRTPLHNATYQGYERIVKLLLDQRGIDVNAANNELQTPLQIAIIKGRPEAFEMLLARPDIDVNWKDHDGRSALQLAVISEHELIMGQLTCHEGVDVNSQDLIGNTALFYAVKQGALFMVRILIAFNADPRVKNHDGTSPADRAWLGGYPEIIKLVDRPLR